MRMHTIVLVGDVGIISLCFHALRLMPPTTHMMLCVVCVFGCAVLFANVARGRLLHGVCVFGLNPELIIALFILHVLPIERFDQKRVG